MDINEKTLERVIREGNSSSRKTLKIIVGLIVTLAGGGGIWATNTHSQLTDQALHEADRETRLARQERDLKSTADRVESIAILLVQQGRYFEQMVRSVAPPNSTLPPRPSALDAIEAEIMRRGTDH